MEIVVCIKQVPDPDHIKLDSENGMIVREGVPLVINPTDKHALEAALQLKEKSNGRVTVVSMGPPGAAEALREALAMGADRAFLASDRAFAGADTLATASTLAGLINKVGLGDLIICGYSSIDGGTAQVGPQVAAKLKFPFFTAVQKIEPVDQAIALNINLEDGELNIETQLPALVTVQKWINKPRGIRLSEAKKAKSKELAVFGLEELKLDPETVGEKGSGVCMAEILPLPQGKAAEMLTGETEIIVKELYQRIAKLGLLEQGVK